MIPIQFQAETQGLPERPNVLIYVRSKAECFAAENQLASSCNEVLTLSSIKEFLDALEAFPDTFHLIFILGDKRLRQKMRERLARLETPVAPVYVLLDDYNRSQPSNYDCFRLHSHDVAPVEEYFFRTGFAGYYFSLNWRMIFAKGLTAFQQLAPAHN